MLRYVDKVERVILMSITVMMVFVLFFSTLRLAYMLVKDLISPPMVMLDIKQLLEVFGLFLLVLIGVELLETMKTFIAERVIRVQVVFMVALIAVARKVIILDIKTFPGLTLIGIGVIVVALSVGYYLITRLHKAPSS
jgi:uncharacterized membrane protein (DUF373 family)